MTQFNKSQLPNGIRVVTERHADSRAVAIGVWVEAGTRDEPDTHIGLSHFLEHLVFKGTKTRSALEIVRAFESVGGEVNAYTTREYTVYHGLVLKEDWEMALEILSDLVAHAELKDSDIELERSVILQEIAMAPDNLEEYIFDLYFEDAYAGHPMGRPILGTEESLKATGKAAISEYYKNHYTGPKIIISAAGALDHQAFVNKVTELLGDRSNRLEPFVRTAPDHKAFRRVVERPSEQVHLLMGMPATSFKDDLRFESYIVNALLGGGMTSKLYQSVREQKGLVYSIYSSLMTAVDSGIISIYAGTEKKHIPEVLSTIAKEMAQIRTDGVSKEDIELFRHQVRGSILLSADDVENRMTSLGVNEMVFQCYRPVDDVISEVQAVTKDSLMEYLDLHYKPEKMGIMLLGEGVESKQFKAMIEDWEA